jgi:O-antigen ligase
VLGLIWNLRFQMQAAIVGLASLTLLRAAVPGLLGTIMSLFQNFGNDPSVQNRQADYPIVFRYIAERPIFGRGPGTFTPERYILLDNEILMTLVQTGYVGLFVFFSLFAVAVYLCRSVAKHTSDPESRHLAQALMASVLGGLVASFTFDSLSFVTFATTLFLFFGVIGALWRLDREAGGNLPPRPGYNILKPNRLLRSRSRQSPTAPA